MSEDRIARLERKIVELEKKITQQTAISHAPPQTRIGDITATSTDSGGNTIYTVQERDVDALKTNKFAEVRALGEDSPGVGDTVAFNIDQEGKRYLYPSGSNEILLIESLGATNGRNVILDSTGTKTVPTDSETLPTVLADKEFYFLGPEVDVEPLLPNGRIVPGVKLTDNGGTSFYLVFVIGLTQTSIGAGGNTYEHTSSQTISDGDLLYSTIFTDKTGKVFDHAISLTPP